MSNGAEKYKIWLSIPHMSGKEIDYIHEAFESNWITSLGPNVDAFENELSSYLGIQNVAALSSGTSAIHLALLLLGVGQDDDVIVSSLTFSATVNPIIYCGANPVFIDSELSTWNMDPDLLEKAIIDRLRKGRKPKAIIYVHIYGMPAKTKEILDIAKKYDIKTIEDAAEAFGSSLGGKKLGTFGDIGILSFNGNKIITTSGGGALISENPDYVKRAKFLATQAREDMPHYEHSTIGYNYRLSNILAGIGRGQLEVIEDRVKKRRNNNFLYRKLLSEIEEIKFLTEPDEKYFSNYWLTTILINKADNNSNIVEKVRLELEKNKIESRPLWKPMHMQPVFLQYDAFLNGNSEYLFDNGLCLPSGSNLSESEIEEICDIIIRILKR